MNDKISDQTMEYARLLDQVRVKFPDLFRHIVGLIRTILK